MPRNRNHQNSQHAGSDSAILMYDPKHHLDDGECIDGDVIASVIQCFDRAIEEHPDFVVIRFSDDLVSERRVLAKLCAALKRNSHSRGSRVLALLPTKHRLLLEELERAGVDYIWFEESPGLDHKSLPGVIKNLSAENSPEEKLSPLCPFLHYARIAEEREMTVCGAYLDRLVLAGNRLHQLCETEAHRQCEHFVKPRKKSKTS